MINFKKIKFISKRLLQLRLRLLLKKCSYFLFKGSYNIIGHQYITLGENVVIGDGARIEVIDTYNGSKYEPVLDIGKNTFINNRVHIATIENVTIGDDCLFGSNVFISDHNHGDYSSCRNDIMLVPAKRDLSSKPVLIGNSVWIGENVVILPGAKIGNNVVIGANSVVRGEITDYCVVAGAPARILKKFSNEIGDWEVV